VRVVGDSAGLHLLLEFGKAQENAAQKEMELVQAAREEGVKVYPLGDYYIEEEMRCPAVLLGFARLSEKEIVEGMQRLKKGWKEKVKMVY
jgi:GntR family transcriptional regulator/MocR family aminotransferase